MKHQDRVAISTEMFSLTLDDLGHFVHQTPQENHTLTPDQLFVFFTTACESGKLLYSRSPISMNRTSSASNIRWADGHPASASAGLVRTAITLAERVLNIPQGVTVTLTQLGGGFSGSYVVKATFSDRPKCFVLKMDEDPSRLRKELEGYERVAGRVASDFWLPPQPGDMKCLFDDYWGAFALPYDARACH